MHHLIIDNAGIWIINSAMSTDQELWMISLEKVWRMNPKEAPELSIGVDDIGDTWLDI
jgi:hypothetical protein